MPSAHQSVLDAIPLKVATCNRYTICSGIPANVAGIASVALAQVALTAGDGNGDFVIAAATPNGRRVRVLQQLDIPITANGDANYCVVDDGVDVLYVFDGDAQTLVSGGTVTGQEVSVIVPNPVNVP